jgi:hypothetical protein
VAALRKASRSGCDQGSTRSSRVLAFLGNRHLHSGGSSFRWGLSPSILMVLAAGTRPLGSLCWPRPADRGYGEANRARGDDDHARFTLSSPQRRQQLAAALFARTRSRAHRRATGRATRAIRSVATVCHGFSKEQRERKLCYCQRRPSCPIDSGLALEDIVKTALSLT